MKNLNCSRFLGLLALILLFGVSSACQHQAKITAIEIKVDGIQRALVPFTIENLSEGEARWHWAIRSSENDSLIVTSSLKTPTFSLPAGAYDILLTGTAANTITRHFRRVITVLPPVFTAREADEIIDLSSSDSGNLVKDYKKVVRPGYRILVKGKLNGRLKITGLRGTKDKPVHIINQGQVEINATLERSPFGILWSNDNQYILFDGKADPSVRYGFKITGHPRKSAQVFFVGGEFNRGFEMCGVHIIGHQGSTYGAAGVQVQTSYTEQCNAQNWSFEYFKIHHCKIEKPSSEGMYIGYFTDEVRDNGFAPHRLGQVLIYRDTVLNAGWDAMQVALADEFEIHNNYVDGSSLSGKRNHSSFVSWNGGNIEGYCYRNTFMNSAQAVVVGYGDTGERAYLYANLLIEGSYPKTINTPNFLYSKLNNTKRKVGLYIFNNTIRTTRIPCKIQYTNADPDSVGIPLVFAGNAIVMNRINLKKYPEIAMGSNLRDSASWTINNEWRMMDKEAELKWDKEHHPKEGSPLLRSPFDVQENFPDLKGGFYDRDGYPLKDRENGYPYGCFSTFRTNL